MASIAKDRIAASVVVHQAARMTRRGRQRIAAWLRRRAKDLELNGDNYAARFTGRYRY